MSVYESPELRAREPDFGDSSIRGVATAVAGFAILAERGSEEPLRLDAENHRIGLEAAAPLGALGGRAVRAFFENGGHGLHVVRVSPPGTAEEYGRALAALEAIDGVSIVALPDVVAASGGPELARSIQERLVGQCERRRDRFAILDTPDPDAEPAALAPPVASSRAAVYHPWLEVSGAGGALRLPPSAAVAGLYARIDAAEGVHKAPVGELVGFAGVSMELGESDQATLLERGVNPIRRFPGQLRVWGARTAGGDSEWKYVPVRRYAIFLRASIEAGTRWVVFEPNDEPLWAQLRRSIESFLHQQWSAGALRGEVPEDAFYVKVDSSTMTAEEIAAGRVVVHLGFAPLKPAEFVVLKLELTARREPGRPPA